jgi:hypothetical protein
MARALPKPASASSLTPGTDYSVNVHKSMTDKAVISCGDLKAGGEPSRNGPARYDCTQAVSG